MGAGGAAVKSDHHSDRCETQSDCLTSFSRGEEGGREGETRRAGQKGEEALPESQTKEEEKEEEEEEKSVR